MLKVSSETSTTCKPETTSIPLAPSRRNFMQSSLAVGAVATSSFLTRTVHAAGSDILKVGLVGCGGRGRGAAENAANADPGVRITALADMFPDRIARAKSVLQRNLRERFTVTDDTSFVGFDAYQKMLDSGIDVILLASPPHFRPDHLEASVKAGVHVFCEKPVATDPTGVRRVLAACQAAEDKKLNVVSGLCWRYDQGVLATMQQIFDGAIGDVITVQENYLTGTLWQQTREDNWTDMHYQLANWLYFRWLSGDHIAEQFIHSLDKALWLHGDKPPMQCWGQGGRQVRTSEDFGDVYDHFTVVYEWEDGRKVFASTRQMTGCFNETEDFVYGTKGTAKVLANTISDLKGNQKWKFATADGKPSPSMYDLEHVALFKAIREGRAINNGKYMSYSTLMAIMGREACYSGQVIKWEDALNAKQDLRPVAYEFGPAPEVVVKNPGSYDLKTNFYG